MIPSFIGRHLQMSYKKTEIRDHPLLYCFLEITRNCNLSCKHCGSDCSSHSTSTELTISSWLKILETIKQQFIPAPFLVLTGGEPLIHPEFKTIVKKINDLSMNWGLVSNGYCLDADLIAFCKQNQISSITISIDGSQANHTWLRGKNDSWEKALKSIQLIHQNKISFSDVVTCVNPRNISELDSIAELLIESGASHWRLFRIFPAGRAKNNHDLLLSKDQTRKMIEWIMENKIPYKKRGLMINLSCEGFLPYRIDKKVRDQMFFCRSGINIGSILCDGTITGCSNNDPEFYEGNILKDSFPFIWHNGFKKFRDRSWIKNTNCDSCKNIADCEGGSIHLWRYGEKQPDICYAECFD